MLVMICFSISIFAQQEKNTFSIEPNLGLSVTNLTHSDMDSKTGLLAGLHIQYQLNKPLAIVSGIEYATYGAKDGTANLTLGFLEIPALIKCYVYKGLAFHTGLIGDINIHDGKTDFILPSDAKKFNVGLPIGASYDFKHLSIRGQYIWGLSKVYDDFDYKNKGFQITLGYKFAL